MSQPGTDQVSVAGAAVDLSACTSEVDRYEDSIRPRGYIPERGRFFTLFTFVVLPARLAGCAKKWAVPDIVIFTRLSSYFALAIQKLIHSPRPPPSAGRCSA